MFEKEQYQTVNYITQFGIRHLFSYQRFLEINASSERYNRPPKKRSVITNWF